VPKCEKRARAILNIFRQFGLDPILTIRGIRSTTRYIRDLRRFKSSASKRNDAKYPISISPALMDFTETAGSADGHYFWQDLYCAQWINARNPDQHLDIGSRIDGFVAHLLSSREVTVIDIRGIENEIPNLNFIQADLQAMPSQSFASVDSVSSLHSIEHFGLGRYGDPLDFEGHTKGLINISKLVKPSGYLYISFPIGEPMIQFNQQRILHPNWPIEVLTEFQLERFILIPWKGSPILNSLPDEVDRDTQGQAGLYEFRRLK
jgi:hypothetical protein